MVYNTQNHWVCGLCPLPGILDDQKTEPFGSWICFRLQVKGGRHLLLGPLERVNLNHWVLLFLRDLSE
jgi:hypothetical protein